MLLCTAAVFIIACNPQAVSNESTANDQKKISCPPGSELDIQKIEQLTGMKGTGKNGEYKITVPQNDLSIVVDEFKIIPAMGLGKLGRISTLRRYSDGNGRHYRN